MFDPEWNSDSSDDNSDISHSLFCDGSHPNIQSCLCTVCHPLFSHPFSFLLCLPLGPTQEHTFSHPYTRFHLFMQPHQCTCCHLVSFTQETNFSGSNDESGNGSEREEGGSCSQGCSGSPPHKLSSEEETGIPACRKTRAQAQGNSSPCVSHHS